MGAQGGSRLLSEPFGGEKNPARGRSGQRDVPVETRQLSCLTQSACGSDRALRREVWPREWGPTNPALQSWGLGAILPWVSSPFLTLASHWQGRGERSLPLRQGLLPPAHVASGVGGGGLLPAGCRALPTFGGNCGCRLLGRQPETSLQELLLLGVSCAGVPGLWARRWWYPELDFTSL